MFDIVFISNYYNHHQSDLSVALFFETDGGFLFIETEPMEEERKDLGWGSILLPSFVKQSYTSQEDFEKCMAICENAEVVIIGSAPDEFVKERLKQNKLTFRYSERYFKEGKWRILDPRVFISHFKRDFRYRNKNLYMLCASAYTAPDCRFILSYPNKTYKWGYFPPVKKYEDIDQIIKLKHPVSILWAARFIKWKHPEAPLYVAKKLKEDGYEFEMNLIGGGELEEKIKTEIENESLGAQVKLLGTMSPEKVREYMEQSEIFLFTSDRNEGWGAVLNESMNSACAVVASDAIGSVPYLINDEENGLIYRDKDWNDLYKKVKYLLDNQEKRKSLGEKAYKTLTETWNADVAAGRLLTLIDCIKNGKSSPFDNGPCSCD